LIVGLGLAVVAAAVVVFVVLVFGVVNGPETGRPAPSERADSPTEGASGPTEDPGTAPPPSDAQVARQTLDYLAGAGAPAMTVHRVAAGLGARPSPDQCRQAGATLDRDAPPDQLVLVIEGVQDEVLRDAMSAERASLGVTLTACAQESEPTGGREVPLPEAVRLVQARLDELAALR
jgi:hypothetical protein